MKCLSNIVGLEGACDTRDSLTYINDCIPFKLWAKLATDEDISGKRMFERISRQACENLVSDFLAAIPNANWHDVVSSKTYGLFTDEVIDCSGIVGRKVTKACLDPYLSPQTVSICLYSKIDIEGFELSIKDDCGIEVIETDIVCGKNVIDIGRTSDIEIFFESEGTQFCSADKKSVCGCSSSCDCSCFNCYEIDEIGFCVPFQLCVNCICLPEEMICKYKYQLKDALKWQIAGLFWEAFEVTCNKNEVARNMVKNARVQADKIFGGATSDEFEKIARRDSKYWRALYNALKRIKLKPSACTSCKGSYYKEEI